MKQTEIEKFESQGVKVTICKPQKYKSSNIVKSKFHKKAKRANNNNGPSLKVISGIYGDDKQLNGELQHRGRNPLAAQQNRAVENH